jgi:hypothetical protein
MQDPKTRKTLITGIFIENQIQRVEQTTILVIILVHSGMEMEIIGIHARIFDQISKMIQIGIIEIPGILISGVPGSETLDRITKIGQETIEDAKIIDTIRREIFSIILAEIVEILVTVL